MGRTLLIGTHGSDWSSYRPDQFLLLDPDEPSFGPSGRVAIIREGKPRETVFVGTKDILRAPHVVLAGLSRLLEKFPEDGVIQCFGYRDQPLAKQTLHLVLDMICPDRLVITESVAAEVEHWPLGPEIVSLPAGVPTVVQDAQRRAQWLRLIENSHAHELSLKSTWIQNARLGSGRNVYEEWILSGFSTVLHAEIQGRTLFVISEAPIEDRMMSVVLDHFHASRLVSVQPREYENLLCAFAREDGKEFGLGRIEKIDFSAGVIHVMADALPPVPVYTLKLGLIRVDANGREDEELKPWQA